MHLPLWSDAAKRLLLKMAPMRSFPQSSNRIRSFSSARAEIESFSLWSFSLAVGSSCCLRKCDFSCLSTVPFGVFGTFFRPVVCASCDTCAGNRAVGMILILFTHSDVGVCSVFFSTFFNCVIHGRGTESCSAAPRHSYLELRAADSVWVIISLARQQHTFAHMQRVVTTLSPVVFMRVSWCACVFNEQQACSHARPLGRNRNPCCGRGGGGVFFPTLVWHSCWGLSFALFFCNVKITH